jgi:pimeloyl-ACP methyl ester carboxylesterase
MLYLLISNPNLFNYMTSILRINHFVESANQAYSSRRQKYLCADQQNLHVHQLDLPWCFSAKAKAQNTQSWEIFRQSLIDTIGQQKFDWICHRYRSQLNFTRMEKTGQAMLPKHVELFSTGASQVLGRDIKFRFPEKIKTLSRSQLTERMRQIQPFPIVGTYKDPVSIFGCPGSTLAYFFHDKVLMDKEKQLLFLDLGRLSFSAWQERLTKVIVNRELLEGQLVPAPGHDGHIDYYKVYKKISTGDGLVAYAFRPAANNSTLQPMLVFRSSQWAFSNEDAFETYLNDAQANVGEMGWKASSSIFGQLMTDAHFRRNNEKISVAGFSLGGAHAQHFLANHADNVARAVFYNNPSVDEGTAERFAERMKQVPRRTEPLNIQIFRMRGDFCDHVGGKHLGWGVNRPDVNIQLMEVDHENKKVAAFTLHSHRIFDNTIFPYQMQRTEDTQQLFNHLDNSKRGPDVFWYEKMHRCWGKTVFFFLYGLSKAVKFISAVFRIKILRSSTDPYL